MKKWYITNSGVSYECSLVSLAGVAKVAYFKCEGETINFQFMKFFDFSRAKSGKQQTGWVKLPHSEGAKVRAQIIFKEQI